MKIGYARVSTKDQNLSVQVDALTKAGCQKIYQEKANGFKAKRPELAQLLEHVREGDTIVVWKLDRLGRKLKHLVEMVETLEQRKVGLISLNDPIDTTNAQGWLIFRIFASLAEYERELIRERTQAGLASTRRRGQQLGRPAGLSERAEKTSHMAANLYRERRHSVKDIAEKLSISKSTLYEYLRHRGIEIGTLVSRTKEPITENE